MYRLCSPALSARQLRVKGSDRMRGMSRTVYLVAVAAFALGAARRPEPFAIQVVDDQTGRGVPLVELRTVSNVRYYTDSAGFVAVDDPALMGQAVYFNVFSHGYERVADGFGKRGQRFEVTPGGSGQIKITRRNIAERLYRITGEGIYHDSVVLGRPVPIKKPLINALVTGQDSTQRAIYKGKIHWFWGDTNRMAYPLGHFGTAAATSDLPSNGGLDPSAGIDLDYLVGDDGFSRPVFEKEGNHPVWLDGLMVLKGPDGAERLVGMAAVVKGVSETVARRLSVFDDETGMFQTLKDVPLDAPLYPASHPLAVDVDGVPYLYGGVTFPNVRWKADWAAVQDLSGYEAFTCLAPGERFKRDQTKLERDSVGKLVWAWKRDTAGLGHRQLRQLVDAKLIRADEAWPLTMDVETKKPVSLLIGSVAYNRYRRKYAAICTEHGGKSSYLGEIWYAEADRPEGPWPWARKVVTHDRYSFYNPVQHPFFEQDGGRVIYFEGTYVTTFSREDEDATPRYDYNQVMYRLDLSDPRLALP
jgi:hypothetical protein